MLGDVIVGQALVQYDFGKQYPKGCKRKDDLRDTLGRPNPAIRSILAKLGTRQCQQRTQKNIELPTLPV